MKTMLVKQGVLLSFTILSLAACGGGSAPQASAGSDSTQSTLQIDPLATFDSGLIEIDACPNTFLGDTAGCTNSAWAGDANLFVGPDHDTVLKIGKTAQTQPSPSQSYAYPGQANIDWETLLSDANKKANHVRFDFQTGNAPDPTSFPQSNSCVGSSQVLSKMDLTAVTVSNNATYAYFGVQRKDHDGDAGYMWLFTKRVPLNPDPNNLPAGSCGPTELRYQLTDGDVMFRGHFVADTTEKLLFVYTIPAGTIVSGASFKVGNVTYNAVCPGGSTPCYVEMPAKDAINWVCDPLVDSQCTVASPARVWHEKADGVAAAAVNSTPAGAGSLGLGGVGATLALNATETVGNGQTAQTWKCTDPNGCMQSYLFAEVAVPVSVFTGGGAVCSATFYGSVITRPSGNNPTPDMKDLAGPYQFNFGSASVAAAFSPSCTNSFGYKVTSFSGLGGPGDPSTCTWTVNGPNFTDFVLPDTSCAVGVEEFYSNSNLLGAYTIDLTASDGQGCTATASGSVTIYSPVQISLAATPASLTCDSTKPDDDIDPKATFTATASQGSGSYSYHWAGACSGTATDDNTCDVSNATTCQDETLSVYVTDATCGDSATKYGKYTKVTTITTQTGSSAF